MITPKLEAIIHKGWAQYRVWNAMSMSQVLPVDTNTSIVITDIWYNSFVNTDLDMIDLDIADVKNVLDGSIHKLSINSNKSMNHLIIRDDVNLIPISDSGLYTVNPLGMKHYNVYFTHENDIFFDLTHIPETDSMPAPTIGRWAANSKEMDQPNGYGKGTTGELLITNLKWGALGKGEFRPVANTAKPNVAQGNSYIQANWDISNDTKIQPPDSSNIMYTRQVPVFSIGYVQINTQAGKKFMSS